MATRLFGVMQAIAEENNLSETAFFVGQKGSYYIRWFTPTTEVALCGHATLAAAYVLFNEFGVKELSVTFDSLSGLLSVSRNGDLLTLDFPIDHSEQCEITEALVESLGARPEACFEGERIMAVFETDEQVKAIVPDHNLLQQSVSKNVIVTAPSDKVDFVSRFFAPKSGIPEDPVTGSAHTQLIPYWAERLNKNYLSALQISARGGELSCQLVGDRALMSGKGFKFLEGQIEVPDELTC